MDILLAALVAATVSGAVVLLAPRLRGRPALAGGQGVSSLRSRWPRRDRPHGSQAGDTASSSGEIAERDKQLESRERELNGRAAQLESDQRDLAQRQRALDSGQAALDEARQQQLRQLERVS